MAASPAAHVFGLTGGLGSGKSSVANHYRGRGLPVLDADALAREVVAPGSPGLARVAREFGPDLVQGGALDRQKLAALVFADPGARQRLENITHPLIGELRDARVRELEARGEPLVGYEVPLLFEKGLERALRPVVLVSAPEPLQVARAQRRDQSSEQAIRARLAAQLPLSEKASRADYIIDNSGLLAATLAQADDVLRRVCADVGVDPRRYFAGSSQETPSGGGSVTRG